MNTKHNVPISKPILGDAEKQAVMDVLDSGMIVQGPRTAELEKRFAAVVGTKHAIATSSGTTALHLAMLAHGIGPGDEVITSPFTFIASVNSIIYAGATPVYCDVREQTFNMDVSKLESLLTPRTKAILPVHLYGTACDMTELLAFAKKHNLVVIEDCAQSIGASYQDKMTGSMGTGCFSLYATKNVMSGEGGMVTTNSDEIADLVRTQRGHGMRRRYYHDLLGFNFRMTDLHAAIGVVQLGRLNEFTSKRQANAAYLSAHLRGVKTPTVAAHRNHVWHQYTVRLAGATGEQRDAAVAAINEQGVGCGVFYPIPANRQQHIIDLGLHAADVPVAERLASEVFSLPVHPSLTSFDLEHIVNVVNSVCGA